MKKFKIFVIAIFSIIIAYCFPWIVQVILNALFLFTSIIVFSLIYAIIMLIKSFTTKKSGDLF